MNIFAVSQDPILTARVLPDKLVVKMQLEMAQCLSVALANRGVIPALPKFKREFIFNLSAHARTKKMAAEFVASTHVRQFTERPLYKPSHAHHPAVLWLSESMENCAWGCAHGLELCEEYMRRYGVKEHGAWWPLANARYVILDATGANSLYELYVNATPTPMSMPDDLKGPNNSWSSVTASYRRYIETKSYVQDGAGYTRKLATYSKAR